MAYKRKTEPDAHGYAHLLYLPVEIRICEDDLSNAKWFEHLELGRSVDVAAMDVTDAVTGLEIRHVNALESDAVLEPFTSQDVFVVGFPFGQITGAPAPVWKRGTIALDPTFNPEALPKMFVDTATREGMSGSVVIARHIIVNRAYLKKDGTKTLPILYATLDVVVGIYSGRHYPDLEKAQIGIVWKRKAIEETVQRQKLATPQN